MDGYTGIEVVPLANESIWQKQNQFNRLVRFINLKYGSKIHSGKFKGIYFFSSFIFLSS